MNTVCDINKCNGCMACFDICPKHCIKINDGIDAFNAIIDKDLCINCKLCKQICPNITKVEKVKPIEWKQGFANEEVRKQSSSGGAASAIMINFIKSGGYVASCLFKNGDFVFEITNDLNEARCFAGSKYAKSNPTGIYKKINERLKTNKVLFIGLPCQVAALKNFIKNQDRLYTIDLICHGTPSVKLLTSYLEERGYEMDCINHIGFRHDTDFGLWVNNVKINTPRVIDHYLCSFLESVDYTENCYSCQFATLERVSDMTLGDSWGSDLKDEEKKGISLILVQSEKGRDLLYKAGLNLSNVDLNVAIQNNHQLMHPSVLTSKRNKFLKLIDDGHTIEFSTFVVLPKLVLKQIIKQILIQLHIIK